MTGFLESLAARVRPDRSTVRPRPDALLLAHLQPDMRPAPEPIVNDDGPAGPPPRPRRRTQPPPELADANEHTTATDQPVATSPPPPRPADHIDIARPRPADDIDIARPRPPLPSRPVVERGTERAIAPTPSVPAIGARTFAEPDRDTHTRRSQRPADATAEPQHRPPLTSRPTSDPAAQPPTQRSPTSAASPISILARANESGDRVNTGQRRTDTEATPPVEITIDRIDVRLQNAPPPARAPRTAPRAPMSLERYLELRERSTNGRAP
jgi:hypothetical protein